MNAIDERFRQLRQNGRRAFIPFLTAGDPDLETTGALVRELARRGADIVEIGIPYSDPIADGPVIQASYTRALEKGLKLDDIFTAVGGWRRAEGGGPRAESNRVAGSERSDGPASVLVCPFVSMVSYSILYRHGPERYLADAKQAGFSGAIVPDLPVDEAEDLARLAAECDFSLIQLVTPTTPRERAARNAAASTGFLYYVSVTGITGERDQLPERIADHLDWLRKQTDLPLCVGFGISRPEQVRALRPLADGVIVGSALIRRLADADGQPREQLVGQVGDFAAELIAALNEQ